MEGSEAEWRQTIINFTTLNFSYIIFYNQVLLQSPTFLNKGCYFSFLASAPCRKAKQITYTRTEGGTN